MSRLCKSCNCKMAFDGLLVMILLSRILLATGHGRSLSTDRCADLLVLHGQSSHLHQPYTVSLSLVDSNTQEEKLCYDLNTEYSIRMKTNAPTIKGFLIIQDRDKIYGKFAVNDLMIRPPHMNYGLCTPIPSVTHDDCGNGCSFGKVINFPYVSPDGRKIVEFRYSVVFDYNNYVQDEKTVFHPCSKTLPDRTTAAPTTEVPTAPSIVCNATEFNLDNKPTASMDTCGSTVNYSTYASHEENGTTYDCKYNDTKQGVKKVKCDTQCDKTGKTLCCKVRRKMNVTRTFECTPISGSNSSKSISKNLTVLRESRCICYPCEEVCPTERPVSKKDEANSVEYHPDPDAGQTNRVET